VGRRLGQHFLQRQSFLRRIAAAACPRQAATVIEIGPGRGSLTRFLLERASRVVAVELDSVLANHLRLTFQGEPGLLVVEGDVLRVDLAQWGKAAVVGNLPYYITSPIITRILDLGPLLERAVIMVQKEVARRLTATPGTRDYGLLSVHTQLFAEPEVLFPVPASAFRPPPKVDSAVVRLTPRTGPSVADPAAFLRFVGRCFRHKRKTLRNNLAGSCHKAFLDSLPEAGLRAEQLSIEQFKQIHARLAEN